MMDDGMLSQEEINALLNVANEDEAQLNESEPYLSSLEIDALGEIGNISLGSSATTLSTLLDQKVEITTPTVSIVRKTGLKEEFPYEHVSLQVNYIDGFDGENIFLMKTKDAAIISDIMLGGDGLNPKEELTEIELSAVQEAMNQMMGASATSMSTVFSKKVDISPPTANYDDIYILEEVTSRVDEEVFVRVSFSLKVGDLIDSIIMQLMPIDFAKTLVDVLLNPPEETPAATQVEEAAPTVTAPPQVEQESAPVGQGQPVGMQSSQPQHIGGNINQQSQIQAASFSTFDPVELNDTGQRNLDMLLDIPLQVTVELGRTKRTVEEILEFTQGSIIELDKLAGEPVDIFVNQKLIAQGEVVVIDENFGVRVTDILSQRDRLMKLN